MSEQTRVTGGRRHLTMPLWWMSGAAVCSWLLISAVSGNRFNPELLFGVMAPLAATAGTWFVTARTFVHRPDRLTAVMAKGLAIKALAFGAYVVIVLRVLHARPMPFVISFTCYFIGLYAVEAWFLRKLFADGIPRAR